MWYTLLADLVVAVHFGYVAFVVVGQLLIVLGLAFRWRWVRNPWFRCLHLLAIAVVAAETIIDLKCPLTDWEDGLRRLGGQTVEGGTFIGRLLHNAFVFDDLPYDHWAFRASYIGFGVLVLATFLLAPPRFRRKPAAAASPAPAEAAPAANGAPAVNGHAPGLEAAAAQPEARSASEGGPR